ncbi:MAG: DUF3006 domain-containing protein [Clostridiales bacterium]|nr:DUF3006 domain-containing protein [Clostridiales bacterium]
MKLTIDRIHDNIAVAETEDGSMLHLPLSLFPDAEEGAVYEIMRNKSLEKARKKKIKNLMERLFIEK